jgi:hypothetical protein
VLQCSYMAGLLFPALASALMAQAVVLVVGDHLIPHAGGARRICGVCSSCNCLCCLCCCSPQWGVRLQPAGVLEPSTAGSIRYAASNHRVKLHTAAAGEWVAPLSTGTCSIVFGKLPCQQHIQRLRPCRAAVLVTSWLPATCGLADLPCTSRNCRPVQSLYDRVMLGTTAYYG